MNLNHSLLKITDLQVSINDNEIGGLDHYGWLVIFARNSIAARPEPFWLRHFIKLLVFLRFPFG